MSDLVDSIECKIGKDWCAQTKKQSPLDDGVSLRDLFPGCRLSHYKVIQTLQEVNVLQNVPDCHLWASHFNCSLFLLYLCFSFHDVSIHWHFFIFIFRLKKTVMLL